jgi:dipeptide/tripeptide permease
VHLPALGFVCSGFFLLAAVATESRPILALALTLFGFGRGLYDCNIMPLLCYIARPELRAAGYGVFNCGGCLAGGVMAAAAGVLKSSIGLEGSMRWSAAGLGLAALLLWGPLLRAIRRRGVRSVP